MHRILYLLAALAAAIFLLVSATANSLFLSSLGRTALESGLLGAVSIAADIAKAILPVVLVRAFVLRAWLQVSLAGLLLAATIALSLASGLGFTAMTRSAVTAARESTAGQIAGRQASLTLVEQQLSTLPPARPSSVVEVDLQAALTDWRWTASKHCTETPGRDTRQFCAGQVKLRAEQAAAVERDKLALRADGLRREVEQLRAGGDATGSDPQVAVFAVMLGLGEVVLRSALSSMVAVVLELGSVVLILLVSGPALRGWKEPGEVPAPPSVPATLPVQADRAHWEKQRARRAIGNGVGSDANER